MPRPDTRRLVEGRGGNPPGAVTRIDDLKSSIQVCDNYAEVLHVLIKSNIQVSVNDLNPDPGNGGAIGYGEQKIRFVF